MNNNIFLSLIFLGSVFLTSGKFVNAENTPKFYFVTICLLVASAFIALSRKSLNICVVKSKTTRWGIYIVCFAEACYGLFQLMDWFPSNHSEFAITGSFDNPAGFAAVLAMGFPIGLFLLTKSNKIERYFAVIIIAVIVIAVFLSVSRTGVLSILISSWVFFLFQSNIIGRVKQFRCWKLISILTLATLIAGSFMLYHQKMDSANGRLLIWKISSEMIKDKPILGHGYGAFQAKYMDYQAEYFKNNPNSKFELLADNVKHPFNEFIKVAVEYGIIGLVTIISIILFILWKVMKSSNMDRELVFSGLISFLVFACFSYPLQYIAVWVLLAFYLSALFPSKKIEMKDTPISMFMRGVIAIVCTFFVVHTFRQINGEIKWKTIAISSLRGNTEDMLPEYKKLYSTFLKRNPFFLYNYGAELNIAGRHAESTVILNECKKLFNDYDLQMLLADNYHKKGEIDKAVQRYQHTSDMIPCRFLPVYQLFKIYREANQREMAVKYAREIVNKKVKIPSFTVTSIISEAKDYLKENEMSCRNFEIHEELSCLFNIKKIIPFPWKVPLAACVCYAVIMARHYVKLNEIEEDYQDCLSNK